jgi:hypothetical protein
MSVATLAQDAQHKVRNGKTTAHPDPLPQGKKEQAAPSPNGDNGRDSRGRFTIGNLGGPGNPFARRTAQLRKVLVETARDEDIKDVAAALLFQAKAGDVAAAKVWLSYVVGKPAETVNPDALDRDEWQAFLDNTIEPAELQRLRTSMPADLAAPLARYVVPCVAETCRQHLGGLLRADEPSPKQPSAKQRSAVSGQRSADKAARAAGSGEPRRAGSPIANGGNTRGAEKELTERERTAAIGKILKALERNGKPSPRGRRRR